MLVSTKVNPHRSISPGANLQMEFLE